MLSTWTPLPNICATPQIWVGSFAHALCLRFTLITWAKDNLPTRVPTDIRDKISVEDAMKTLGHGPNGALVFCMESVNACARRFQPNLNLPPPTKRCCLIAGGWSEKASAG